MTVRLQLENLQHPLTHRGSLINTSSKLNQAAGRNTTYGLLRILQTFDKDGNRKT